MKKFGLAILGIVAAIVVLSNVGSIVALAISALIAFAGFHYYRKTDSVLLKLFWGVVLLVGLLTAIANIPAFIGILALLGVYYVWREWNGGKNKDITTTQSGDPFVNFERQWEEMTK
ncbi:ABC transporter permease [Sporosarcina oncorhynchi]|uniref:ABC transporter permease n=1 Tax=Sporosarcina oncorhynchi TaxID=3056444 RepID=A0ABZ0L5H5_9BACL|nr:ABC transporter permease [Sporosarcina sp. T2O-4]WOV87796.1 ABC transporter permease [Sporosarcina sp. T2O-4]